VAYLGGPRLHGWVERLLPGAADFLVSRLPWRRKRLQRDFSGILVALLEAGVPEAEAVTLAAESTANREMTRRARTVTGLLRGGKSLPEALRTMDNSGELHWRLKNALRRKRDFLQALAGWHEALEAKAFQLEQSAAQITTTLLVLVNGVIIGTIVIAMFLALIQLLNRATLW
jgi:type II secretory pathway component PulF